LLFACKNLWMACKSRSFPCTSLCLIGKSICHGSMPHVEACASCAKAFTARKHLCAQAFIIVG
jgi:hypothetical protein